MANSNDWYSLIESKIFSKVSRGIEREYGSEIFCTTDEASVSGAEFPCVYIHELEGIERGMDLTNTTINAVMYSMQIDVFATSKAESKKILKFATNEMKALMFNITSMPLIMQDSVDVYHSVARFRRMYGAGDKI